MIIRNDKLNYIQKQINARRVLDLLNAMTGGNDKYEKKNRDLHKRIDKLSRS